MSYSGASLILGHGTVSAEAVNAWYAARGPKAAESYAPDRTYKPAPADLGQLIIEESRRWPSHVVNHDLIAADIAHESAFWQSAIVRDKHNPSGLGAVNDNAYKGAVTFLSPREGIRATVAHMLSYAVGDGPWATTDPRFAAVKAKGWLGTAPRLMDLNGKWAYPGTTYGQQVAAAANALIDFANNGSWEPPMTAQIPGFAWLPADSRHHTKGRTKRISGFAVHYTAGTDSRGWLTTNPNSDVSATFLIRHNPTLDDRGWQLVRIEDTPHTTGGIVNPFTVSFEYEHTGNGTIPDVAYDVMAQTIIDTAAYVKAKGLGEIPLTRDAIKGHKEWVGDNRVCPDGIDVDRIVRRIQELTKPDPQPPSDDWPKVPPAVPDPHRATNPYGNTFWVPKQFAVPMASESFLTHGYVCSEAFAWTNPDGEVLVVQATERTRWELHRDGSVTRGLVGLEWLRTVKR
jgi:hypothetical protein